MPIVVQKYGGTSVGDADKIRRAAERVAAARQSGAAVAVVVSAMGDTTDRLIELAESVTAAPDPRELDVLLSTGELVSCTLMAMALREIGEEAVSMSGAQAGIRTDAAHGRASIVAFDPAPVRRALDAGRIVIVAGFQGITEDMDVTTLGRGAPTRRPSRSPPRSAPRDAKSTRMSTGSTPPTPASSRTRANSPKSAARRCSNSPVTARRCIRAPSNSPPAIMFPCSSRPAPATFPGR